jgi:predicted Zn-dependent protease
VNSVTETGVQTGEPDAYLDNALLQRKKFSEAEVELKNATLEDPGNAEWQALLGYSLFKQKRYADLAGTEGRGDTRAREYEIQGNSEGIGKPGKPVSRSLNDT